VKWVLVFFFLLFSFGLELVLAGEFCFFTADSRILNLSLELDSVIQFVHI
jgi:hypothetical protein